MVRITKMAITIGALLFTWLCTPLAQASEPTRSSATHKSHPAKSVSKGGKSKKEVKKKVSKTSGKKSEKKTVTASKAKITKVTASGKSKTLANSSSKKSSRKSVASPGVKTTARTQKCTTHKESKAQCAEVESDKNLTIAQAHKLRVQKAKKTAMNKLMGQIGKPYRWGGASPHTGFDCSGLVYYAYKDLVKFPIPRTANEMYHLRDASSVEFSELETGDLVFFRIRGQSAADHVGVYVGNGKFIQSPRSGRDIQITSLSESYWQRHYVGARRVMTPKTIR